MLKQKSRRRSLAFLVLSIIAVGCITLDASPAAKLTRTYEPLTEAEQIFLLQIARTTIEVFLQSGEIREASLPSEYRAHLTDNRGVFVSLYIDSYLRGCIAC